VSLFVLANILSQIYARHLSHLLFLERFTKGKAKKCDFKRFKIFNFSS